MDGMLPWQLQPCKVAWGPDRQGVVITLSAWHWELFDGLAKARALRAPALMRMIEAASPGISDPGVAVCRYLDAHAAATGKRRFGAANDTCSTDPQQPQLRLPSKAKKAWRPLPIIKSSPFRPIASVRRLFA